jgi:hypothetical protein
MSASGRKGKAWAEAHPTGYGLVGYDLSMERERIGRSKQLTEITQLLLYDSQ